MRVEEKEEKPKYRRILLKLSGEALMGDRGFGIHADTLERIAREIRELTALGVQTGIVIGGGNIFRGIQASKQGMDRAAADYMGMLATVINSLALQDALEHTGIPTRVLSAIEMREVAEPYIRRRAIRHLEKGRVVIFAAGTGNPHFSTDTAASLRAMEIGAQIILKATKVDGVFDRDPSQHPEAVRLERVGCLEILEKNLRVIDATAVSLTKEARIPIVIFNLLKDGNIKRVVLGERVGTLIWG